MHFLFVLFAIVASSSSKNFLEKKSNPEVVECHEVCEDGTQAKSVDGKCKCPEDTHIHAPTLGKCDCEGGLKGMLTSMGKCDCEQHGLDSPVQPHHVPIHSDKVPTEINWKIRSLKHEKKIPVPTTPPPHEDPSTASKIAMTITSALIALGMVTLVVYGLITLTQFITQNTHLW